MAQPFDPVAEHPQRLDWSRIDDLIQWANSGKALLCKIDRKFTLFYYGSPVSMIEERGQSVIAFPLNFSWYSDLRRIRG
jgi:hypothetical protein